MKKRIFAVLMAVIMVATLVCGAVPAMAADGEITIRIHYHREDGNYEGWELWSWDYDGKGDVVGTAPDGTETNGAPYAYEQGEDEVIFTIRVKAGTMRVGYIVRYGEWEAKDVEFDQHINITGILSGTVDFYVESGVPTQSSGDVTTMLSVDELVEKGILVKGDDVKEGVVVTETSYKTQNRNGDPEITVSVSSALKYEPDLTTFKVVNKDGEIPVTDMRLAGTNYYLVLGEALDLSRGYNIVFEGNEYAVAMPDYYSTEEFESQFTYTGDDLGMTYSKDSTALRVWAPTAISVNVKLYKNGNPVEEKDAYETVAMTADVNGTWIATLDGDMNGVYYTYEVTTDTETVEACDPYARAVGVNGKRAMIIDLASTNPEGWDSDANPFAGKGYTDAVIYELHVRDASMDSSSGVKDELKGKYLGLIESGTKTAGGASTVLDHMVDLGITHVHLLPVYDINSVDETKMDDDTVNHYNWGYDPLNYNVPEGSYSTDPYHGEVRVKEFKQMVKGLHDAGIAVVMDVVYNHVADANKFCVNQIVDGYFTRPNSNGSGCGNDVASERSMVSKYIVDSVNYWADEYHIDGFRFDLAGLIDIDTINEIVETVHEDHPDVIFYGEGWAAGSTTTTKSGVQLAVMANAAKTPNFAYFSDTIRNAVKGGTYGGVSKGFISGASSNTAELFSCFKGLPGWCPTPSQSINYISAHDNNTLYDHICMVATDATEEQKMSMNKLGAAFYISSQGIPFFQAGEEFLRSKPDGKGGYDENSYNSGDAINSLKWSDLDNEAYQNVYEYYKGLIAFRKAHPALRMATASESNSNIFQMNGLEANVVGYQITGGVNGETSDGIVAIFNANRNASTVTLPEGNWTVYVNGEKAGTEVLDVVSGTVQVDALSALILVNDGASVPDKGDSGSSDSATTTEEAPNNTWVIIGIVVGVIAIIGLAIVGIKKK
ncbi:MAG: type I pullulanase [Oscillospiraceae bacterium]|nr:type I pullulanase [Oscillospiraceae bacterium]